MTTPELAFNLIHRVNVGDSLTRTAARTPETVALVDSSRSLTYAEFNRWVNRLANALLHRGFAAGDALGLASGNSVEFLVTYYACAKIGAVCVPINLGWRVEEVAYVLEHSGARGLVVSEALAERMVSAVTTLPSVAEVIVVGDPTGARALLGTLPVTAFADVLAAGSDAEPEVVVDDRAALTYLYTSGTTSFPKGVIGNHTAIHVESLMMALEGRFAADDRFVAMMPMFHTAQLNCHCTPAVVVGATIHIEPGFDPARLLHLIEAEGITQIFGIPMMYRALLDHPDRPSTDLSTLRRALYAMAPMPEATLRECLEVFGCGFYLLFGQTEMSPTTTIFRPEHQLSHNGAAGTPTANVHVAIMADDGAMLPQGETGEIVYRGPQTMTAYLKDEKATDEAFRHGWFHSGDLGHFDTDGLLWFTDRSKDVIKTGGENVASIEVEKAVYAACPQVAEVAVVGLPHARWSEAVTAVVVAKPGEQIDEVAVITAVKGVLDSYKAPKSVIVVTELPRTSTGKIQKNLVRDTFRDHYTPSPHTA
ncbi:long-chain-fatty-acid--CoA ligase [Lapillicoccus sp.]|uniref:long-chain-fatty-acid--CoA ligase n=1 Tax=Lapillicoccus sp. TaxID=1909287 RepID=UPI0025CCB9AC|nr:long-chain-fatty-acid--CoA ligase [Lapillicoccus sp.]